MPSFQTPTDPVLTVDLSQVDKVWRLTITGEREKVLLETEDKKAADAEYKYVKDHYDARKAERDKGTTPDEKREREMAVAFIPKRLRA